MHSDNIVRVGISDVKFAQAPQLIRTSGLGSCVGVVIYDEKVKVAGLAHVMLPDSTLSKQAQLNPFKFADTAIPYVIEKLREMGARKFALKAKVAGGAQMFQFETNSPMMRIGPRNVEAVFEQLESNRIPVLAKCVGGNSGRTIQFNPETGALFIRTVNKGESFI